MSKFLRYFLVSAILFTQAGRASTCLADLSFSPAAVLTPHQRIVKTSMIANAMFPQTGYGINFMMLSLVLNNPEIIPELFSEITLEDVRVGQRMMDRVHAAYEIKYRSAGHPDAKSGATVPPERLVHLILTARFTVLQSLFYLAHKQEPEGRRWLQQPAYTIKAADGPVVAADLQTMLVRQSVHDPDSVLFKYRSTLAHVIESAEYKEFSKNYRHDVSSTLKRFGRRQSDQARWEHVANTSLRSIFRAKAHELWPEDEANQIDELSVWSLD